MRRIARVAAYLLAGLGTLVVLLVAAGLVTIQTAWFRNKVRERIVYEVAHSELRGIINLGAVLGLLVGFMQVALIHWIK
jgi:uncharacterized membrane protein YheB (UPF0754 family)